jgi:hypothetical protein
MSRRGRNATLTKRIRKSPTGMKGLDEIFGLADAAVPLAGSGHEQGARDA